MKNVKSNLLSERFIVMDLLEGPCNMRTRQDLIEKNLFRMDLISIDKVLEDLFRHNLIMVHKHKNDWVYSLTKEAIDFYNSLR